MHHERTNMAKKDAVQAEELETSVAAPEETAAEKPEVEQKEEKKTAKAGKRSEKSLKEVDEKVAKEERKAKGDTTPQGDTEVKAKQKQNPTRSRLERRSKGYRKVAELIEASKTYSLKEALELATKTSIGKFDGTVEIHLNLNVDPRQADQNLRGTVSLPHGTGKTVRVAVFANADQHAAAKKAGADIIGD